MDEPTQATGEITPEKGEEPTKVESVSLSKAEHEKLLREKGEKDAIAARLRIAEDSMKTLQAEVKRLENHLDEDEGKKQNFELNSQLQAKIKELEGRERELHQGELNRLAGDLARDFSVPIDELVKYDNPKDMKLAAYELRDNRKPEPAAPQGIITNVTGGRGSLSDADFIKEFGKPNSPLKSKEDFARAYKILNK